jgi:hypothetical protein
MLNLGLELLRVADAGQCAEDADVDTKRPIEMIELAGSATTCSGERHLADPPGYNGAMR